VDQLDDDYDFWQEHPVPSDRDIARLCETWITYQRRYEHVRDGDGDDPDWWAVGALLQTLPEPRLETEWRVIRCLCALAGPADSWIIEMIGASPLENFLEEHGDEAMDLVAPAAESDPVLMDALAKVWAFDAPVRPRIERYLADHGRSPGGGVQPP
jgi:hypothetical protein